jgi:hypothetical protein
MSTNLDIIANKGIGSFKLGMTKKEIILLIKEMEFKNIREVYDPDKVETELIDFWFNKSNTVSQIMVKPGFSGKFRNEIGIGNSLAEIEKNIGEVYEVLDTYQIKGIKGVCFELEDCDIDEEWDEKSAKIEYISVFKE